MLSVNLHLHLCWCWNRTQLGIINQDKVKVNITCVTSNKTLEHIYNIYRVHGGTSISQFAAVDCNYQDVICSLDPWACWWWFAHYCCKSKVHFEKLCELVFELAVLVGSSNIWSFVESMKTGRNQCCSGCLYNFWCLVFQGGWRNFT